MLDGVPLIDPDIVAGRIAVLLKERRCGAVKPLLAALQKLAPEHRELVLLQTAYHWQMQEIPQALCLLSDAISRQPGNAVLYLRRAEIFFSQMAFSAAAEAAADAVLLEPEGAYATRAKSVLGLAMLKLGQYEAALACLAESFAADPASVDVALALAALDPTKAVEILSTAITATPRLGVLRNALARRHLCVGKYRQAMQVAGQTRAAGLADPETFCLLIVAQMQEALWDEAGISVAQVLSLAPRNSWAARLKSALGGRRAGEISLPPQKDAAAAEQALLAGGTILPGSFRSLLEQSQNCGPVLDLFCGTGMNAVAAQDVCAGPWTGVEPDAKLIELCAERGLYARLESSDPRGYLRQARQYPIILLNEALGYSASVELWLAVLRNCLAPGGIALAGIPTGHPGLTGHGLFAHDTARIAAEAEREGLSVVFTPEGLLRRVEGIPMHGVIASFRHK